MAYNRIIPQHYRKLGRTAWGQNVYDNFEALWTEKPTCRLYRDAATVCADTATVTLSWTNARWDVGGFFDAGTPTRLTAPVDGLYLITAHVDWEADPNGNRKVTIGAESSLEVTADTISGGYCSQTFTAIVEMQAGGYTTVSVKQDSGSTLDVNGSTSGNSQASCEVSALWLGGLDYVL